MTQAQHLLGGCGLDSIWSAAPTHVRPVDGTVDLWLCQLDPHPSVLAPAGGNAWGRLLRLERHRARNIASRNAVKRILSMYLALPPDALCLEANLGQKPRLLGGTIEFSYGHSQSLMLLAVSPNVVVGADLECRLSSLSTGDVATRFFSREERLHLQTLPPLERDLAFYRAWVRKEAYGKALGIGITEDLLRLSITDVMGPNAQGDRLWDVRDIEVGADYAAAIVLESGTQIANRWLC